MKNNIDYENFFKDQRALEELRKQNKELGLAYRAKRAVQNCTVELAASLIESLCSPLMIGGIRVNADRVRDRKIPNPYLDGLKEFQRQYS